MRAQLFKRRKITRCLAIFVYYVVEFYRGDRVSYYVSDAAASKRMILIIYCLYRIMLPRTCENIFYIFIFQRKRGKRSSKSAHKKSIDPEIYGRWEINSEKNKKCGWKFIWKLENHIYLRTKVSPVDNANKLVVNFDVKGYFKMANKYLGLLDFSLVCSWCKIICSCLLLM